MKQKRKFYIYGILFALPWIIGFFIFELYPVGASLYYSFTEFSIFQPPEFTGLENITTLLADKKFYLSLYNTAYITLVGIPLGLVYSLAMAMLLNMKVRGMSIFRTVFYIPTIVPIVASAILFVWILNPQYGMLNSLLDFLGLPQPAWLSDPRYTKPSLIMMDLWRSGQTMIVYLAALQGVPQNIYEAADIDGAGRVKKFWNITLPAISPATLFLFIMGLISSFQYFTQAYVFASTSGASAMQQVSGGPENSLLFYSIYLYQNAFSFLKMGYASAMAWILFIVIVLVTVVVFKTSKRRVYYDFE